MLNYIKNFIIIFLLLVSVSAFSKDRLGYFKKIYVNSNGKVITKEPFQLSLGSYLYRKGNRNIIQSRFRDGSVIEFNNRVNFFYIVYNDNGTVRELGEKSKNRPELSHIYRYNKTGEVTQLDHFHVKDFKYFKKGTTFFKYDSKKQLVEEQIKDTSDKVLHKIVYKYNAQGKKINQEIFSKSKRIKSYKYFYSKKKLVKVEVFNKSKNPIEIIEYNYNSKNKLTKISSKIFNVRYFKTNSRKALKTLPIKKGIINYSREFDKTGIVTSVSGILPNIQCYIKYNFTVEPKKAVNRLDAIKAHFQSISLENHKPLNTIKTTMLPSGKELKVEWYNQKGEELFHKLPKEIRSTRPFALINLLLVKHLVVGKVMTHKKKKIVQDIIVEIYDKQNKRKWCYFINSYYFFLIRFSDPVKDYNKVRILKAGYEYETIKFTLNRSETLYNLSPTYLKIASNK